MLQYHNLITAKSGLTLSVDNIVLDLYISAPAARTALMKLLDALPMRYAVEVTHWDSFRVGAFREQFTIAHQDGTSFWLGAALNGKKTEWGRVRLDFNPNKVAQHTAFQTLLLFLVKNTRPMHRIIKRFDLAIDIPVDRFDCFLVKDSRAYSERRHGQEWTQYLGAKSSTVGRVKLYNKTVEARLNYPLTRLELTLDPAVGYDEMAFPTVYAAFTAQISTDEFEATDTERFILGALLNGYGSLNMLGRKTRTKMERLLELYVQRVEISKSEYDAILSQLYRYTQGRIDAATDGDQPPPKRSELPAWVQDIISETRNLDL